ncbi:MAG: single-stranded-DNA-specific exonuclease RecJ [Verrucomicrobia bacterium]|nr:single-stranded-DNA-specific exonuclease RecJ [Verrucomicrobiota bacterium]
MNKDAPRYRWSIAPVQTSLRERLAVDCDLSPLLAQCLLNRGHAEPGTILNFLDPRLKNLADPYLLPDMQLAVERLVAARESKTSIVIFGDYDVDGVTSTALLLEAFGALGFAVNGYLPNRMEEGYGLSSEGVANCLEKFPVKLLLAVDCGSTSVEQIGCLAQRGVDVIVLDHHQISDPPPEPIALVNPRKNPTGRFHELCSAGLAFKLAHALVKRLRELNCPRAEAFDLKPLLDLVALGTIADIVPLTGENRIFATRGLEWLNTTKRAGLVALKSVAQTNESIGVHEVGFQLGPRLNAAGRLENALQALDLLRATSIAEAKPLADALDSCNGERQKIERGISEQVIGAVRARFNPETDFVIVEGQPLWHIGVVGIVASRVLHEFYRPTIIVGGEGVEWRGSGRSIEGFDLAAALRECDDLLIRHGGHAMAAGLTIDPEKLELFRTRMNEIARCKIKPEELKPVLRLDAEIQLSDLTVTSVTELERLKPFGSQNPSIQLVVRGVSHQRAPQRIGKEGQHVKFRVTDGKRTFDALWWNCGTDTTLPKVMFDLAFVPQINEFNGNSSVQLKVLDWCSV